MSKIALITGATSGFGKATALKLACKGYDIIATGRRSERLADLKKEIESTTEAKVLPLIFDVRVYEEVENALNTTLPSEWSNIDVLVNNAGLAVGMSPIHKGDVDDWNRMIDTNIKGLLYVTRVISPGMVARKSGHIINISSIAGKDAYLNGNVYCATKHAVNALNTGMRLDLLPYGIRVTQICPGAADTEFSIVRFKGDKERSQKVYEGYTPLYAENIADAIAYVISQPSHVTIQDMLVMPTAQGTGTLFHKE